MSDDDLSDERDRGAELARTPAGATSPRPARRPLFAGDDEPVRVRAPEPAAEPAPEPRAPKGRRSDRASTPRSRPGRERPRGGRRLAVVLVVVGLLAAVGVVYATTNGTSLAPTPGPPRDAANARSTPAPPPAPAAPANATPTTPAPRTPTTTTPAPASGTPVATVDRELRSAQARLASIERKLRSARHKTIVQKRRAERWKRSYERLQR